MYGKIFVKIYNKSQKIGKINIFGGEIKILKKKKNRRNVWKNICKNM